MYVCKAYATSAVNCGCGLQFRKTVFVQYLVRNCDIVGILQTRISQYGTWKIQVSIDGLRSCKYICVCQLQFSFLHKTISCWF